MAVQAQTKTGPALERETGTTEKPNTRRLAPTGAVVNDAGPALRMYAVLRLLVMWEDGKFVVGAEEATN